MAHGIKRPGEALESLFLKAPRSRFPTLEEMGMAAEKIAALEAAPRSLSPRRVHVVVPRPEVDSNGFFNLKGKNMEALLNAFQGEALTFDWGGIPALGSLEEEKPIDLLILGGHGTPKGEIIWSPGEATSLKALPPDVLKTLGKVRKIALLSCYQGDSEGAASVLARQTNVPVIAASGRILQVEADTDGELAFYDEYHCRNDYDFVADRACSPRSSSCGKSAWISQAILLKQKGESYSLDLLNQLEKIAREGNRIGAQLLFNECCEQECAVPPDIAWMWLEKGIRNAVRYFMMKTPETLEEQTKLLRIVQGTDIDSLKLRALVLAKMGQPASEIFALLAPFRGERDEFQILDYLIDEGEYSIAALWAEHPYNRYIRDIIDGVLEDACHEGIADVFDRISRETPYGRAVLGRLYLMGAGTHLAPNWLEAERHLLEGVKAPLISGNIHSIQQCTWLLCAMGRWEWGILYADAWIQEKKMKEAAQLLMYLQAVRGIVAAKTRLEERAAGGCIHAQEQLKIESQGPFLTRNWEKLASAAPGLAKFEPQIALCLANRSKSTPMRDSYYYNAAMGGSAEGLAKLTPSYSRRDGLIRMQAVRAEMADL